MNARPANKRWCYHVQSSLVGWVYSQNYPWQEGMILGVYCEFKYGYVQLLSPLFFVFFLQYAIISGLVMIGANCVIQRLYLYARAHLEKKKKWPKSLTNIFKCIFWYEILEICIIIFNFVPDDSNDNKSSFVQVMSWHLTHWGGHEMDTILQTAFSNVFSSMKIFEFRLKIHWSLFLSVQLTIL